jgi:4-amino-4-deoxy-L-arabinose transferase-like glycosyltransferase
MALAILFAAAALRVLAIQNTYMHADEELSYHTTTGHTLTYVVESESLNDVHPPLWYSWFWAWQQVMGDSEFMGRLHAILLSLLTLALAYRLGCEWFGTQEAGLAVLLVLGVNAYFFMYSLDIRPYALVALTVTVSMWIYYRWRNRPTLWLTVAYGFSMALMLYTHYYTVFAIAAQGALILLERRWRLLRHAALAAVIAGVVWLPCLPILVYQIVHIRRITGGLGSTFALGAPTESPRLAAGNLLQVATNGLVWLYVPLLTVGIALQWRAPAYRLALLWALLIPAIVLAANFRFSIYNQRYISYVAVGMALVIGSTLAKAPRFTRVPALLVVAGLSLWALPAQLPVRAPYRTIFQQVSAAAQPGDVLLLEKANETENLMNWQYRHYLAPILWHNAVQSVSTAAQARRIWYVTDDLGDVQVQRDFKTLEQTHPLQQVIGGCNAIWCYVFQLMEAPPFTQPVTFEDHMAFWGVDVDAVTRDSIQTRLWWKVDQPPSADYSIGLYLLNAQGTLVAQYDGPINNFGKQIVPTSQLQPQSIYIDQRTLTLPAGLPAGDYALKLAVYRLPDVTRLHLPDGSDLLTLEPIQLS